MDKFFKADSTVIQYFDSMLQGDVHQIVEAQPRLLAQAPNWFFEMSDNVFVMSQLGNFCEKEASLGDPGLRHAGHLAGKIPASLLNSDKFAMAWFEARLPLVRELPMEWRGNQAYLLRIAQDCPVLNWKRHSFGLATKELRTDSAFMMKVMQFEPSLFCYAARPLRTGNFEMAMLGLTSVDYIRRCIDRNAGRDQYTRALWPNEHYLSGPELKAMLTRAVAELLLHEAFVNPFLCGLQFPNETDSRQSTLSELNRIELKMLIADFVSVARRQHLHNIRQALANLLPPDQALANFPPPGQAGI